MNKARFEAFSDGVYAFAITVLILGIALPVFKNPPSDRELAHALLHLWPNLLAYTLSFAVIGIMWQNHHALFRLVQRIDRMTVFLNLVLLGVTVFIPFATSTLGAYPSMRSSTFLYGLTLTGSAIVYNLLLGHLIRSAAFHASASKATIRQTVVAYRVGMATYIVAMLASLVAPAVSFALYLVVVAYYLFPRGADADLAGKSAQG
ncbi:MAG TPA: TMEM175 family protein [Candidatus Acidoferrales bacterium]|nr:TMEM175 family protein [Candidatus Acidoferrales bacterium]